MKHLTTQAFMFLFLFSLIFSFEGATELVRPQNDDLTEILPRTRVSSKETVLSFSGDIMAHDTNYNMKDYSKIYEDVKDFLLKDGLSFCNIEMPVSDELPLSSYPAFNVHSNYIEATINAGFDVFSFANNHTNDHQVEGIRGTIQSFNKLQKKFKKKKRLLYFSGIREDKEEKIKPVLIKKNGVKILFLAVTEILNSYDSSKELVYYTPTSPKGSHLLADKIKKMREEIPCDLFILSIHVNEPEYKRKVLEEKRERFKLFAKAGADIIWANHPHVVQEWELVTIECDSTSSNSTNNNYTANDDTNNAKQSIAKYDNTKTRNSKDVESNTKPSKVYKKAFFMYSLGNFISGQRIALNYKDPNHYWEYTGDSILMQLKFPNKNLNLENVKIKPIFITTYKGNDGIVVKQFKSEWISSLPDEEKSYYSKRLELMEAYLPKD